MSKLLKLPNSNMICPSLIKGLRNIPDRGIAVLDGRNQLVDWVVAPDAEIRERIYSELAAVVNGGAPFTQPDWSFITPEVVQKKKGAAA